MGVRQFFVSLGFGVVDEPEKAAPVKVENPVEQLFQNLVELNILIRVEALDRDLIQRLELIIDKLRKLLPDLNLNYAGNELTWVVNQMASNYLAKVVVPYAQLSAAQRGENKGKLNESLDGLEGQLDEVVKLVEGQREGDFNAKALFLKTRFGSQSK